MDRFIFIRGIGLLFKNNFRMLVKKILVVEVNMPDDTQTICDNAEFVGITKMPVNVELFNVWICGGMGRHGAVSSFVRVIVPIKTHGFCISFELFDDTVGILGIVFSNPSFYARRIKDGHSCLSRIYCLTDRFRNINETMEYELQIIQKVLFEAGDFGSIRDLDKTTEFTKMSGIVKENNIMVS